MSWPPAVARCLLPLALYSVTAEILGSAVVKTLGSDPGFVVADLIVGLDPAPALYFALAAVVASRQGRDWLMHLPSLAATQVLYCRRR